MIKSSVELTPKTEWFKAACMYAQTQAKIRKARGENTFDDIEGIDAILKIAMEIAEKLQSAKFPAPEHLNLPGNKY